MLIFIMQFDFVICNVELWCWGVYCTLQTQYAMRHSDVQMTSFGTDHNSGSWVWSVIPFLS